MIVFPMAGLSSRFAKAGYPVPKYMLEACGKSVFAHVVGGFSAYFDNEPFLFIYRDVADTRAFLELECKSLGIKNYRLIELTAPTDGQAETVYLGLKQAEADPEQPLTVFNIDTIRPDFRHPGPEVMAADGYFETFRGEGDAWSFARTVSDSNMQIIETAEKRRISPLCSTGLYHFKQASDFIDAYAAEANRPLEELDARERYIAPLYNRLIAAGKVIMATVIEPSQMVPCGVPAEYEAFKLSCIRSN